MFVVFDIRFSTISLFKLIKTGSGISRKNFAETYSLVESTYFGLVDWRYLPIQNTKKYILKKSMEASVVSI